MLENEVVELIKEKLFNGISRFYVMKKERRETRENRKRSGWERRKRERQWGRKWAREVSTFTKDNAAYFKRPAPTSTGTEVGLSPSAWRRVEERQGEGAGYRAQCEDPGGKQPGSLALGSCSYN